MINSIDILTLFYDILTTTTTNGVNTYYGKHRKPEGFFLLQNNMPNIITRSTDRPE